MIIVSQPFSKVNFTLNEAQIWGSAIFVGQSSTVVSHSCMFAENKAENDEYGGAATAVAWDSGLIVTGATFLRNTGLESSCILSLAGSTMLIDNCSFEENAPTVVLSIENTFTRITNSKFFNNSSPGGAILCLENCGMYVTHTAFDQNIGLDVGAGAILIHYFSKLTTFSTIFVENRANYYGAAIYVSEYSTLSSENCSFRENIAGDETHAGGTIRVENFSILDLSNAIFILNKGKSTSCVSSYWNCQLFVADSTFDNNNGSALGIVTNNYLEITGSVFCNNTAPAFGGAIFSSDNSTIDMANVTFHKNMANTGGAIAIFNSKMTVRNGNFILNMAETGGGIRMERNTEGDLDHCLFLENMATLNGGGVLVNDHSSLKILESEFRLNSAGNSGSAVHARNVSEVASESSLFGENVGVALEVFCSSVLHMSNDVMRGNKANKEKYLKADSQSEVYIIVCSLDNITTSKCENNSESALFDVDFDYSPKASAISIWVNCTGEISNVTFENNTADLNVVKNGGILAASKFTTVHVQNVTFTWNVGTSFSASSHCHVTVENAAFIRNNGAALDLQKSTMIIEESRFLNNKSPFGASAISLSGSTINVTDSTFSENAGGREGAVYIFYSNATFDHCLFVNNSAPRHGGGLWAANSFVNMLNTTATFNRAESGGFLQILFTVMSMSGCSIEKNRAFRDGGGLDITQDSQVEIITSFFEGNNAVRNGGGMHVSNSKLFTQGITFKNNLAGEYGGGVEVDSSSIIKMDMLSFLRNKAKNGFGGAIAASTNTIIYLNKVKLQDNYALRYSALCIQFNSTLNVSNTVLFNNSAERCGTIGVLHSSRMIAIGTDFRENKALKAGCVAINKGEVYLQNCTLIRNQAKKYGGAITTEGSILKIADTTFRDNSAIFGTDISFEGKSTQFDTLNCLFNQGTNILKSSDDQFWKVSRSKNIIFTEKLDRSISMLIHQETHYASSKFLTYRLRREWENCSNFSVGSSCAHFTNQ